MTIYYWDPVSGNNSNDGTTFANRKLTLQSLTGVIAGDTVRCKASPDPTSLGQNATWTDGSNTVTLTTAVTAVIDACDASWTVATNVTGAHVVTARKEGTNVVSVALATAFTTGLVAKKTISSTDFSGYQQVSFWVRQLTGTVAVAGDISICLCSDTAGLTVVNTFSMPALGALNVWHPITIDLGVGLGAAIQSVAIYANVDRGAASFYFDHFIACKASSAADSLTLSSLISRNTGTDPWLAIRSINGVTVMLDEGPNSDMTIASPPLYSGITGAITTWKRETLKTPYAGALTTAVNNFAGTVAGTAALPIVISGGWDATDMSTQPGKTYLDGSNGLGYGLSFNSPAVNYAYTTFNNFSACRYSQGANLVPGYSQPTVRSIGLIGSDFNNNDAWGIYAATGSGQATGYWTITVTNICKNGKGGASITTSGGLWYYLDNISVGTIDRRNIATITITNANSNWYSGIYGGNISQASITLTVTNVNRNTLAGMAAQGMIGSTISIGSASYNGGTSAHGGLMLNDVSQVGCHDNTITFGNSTSAGTGSNAILLGIGCNNNKFILTGTFNSYAGTYGSGAVLALSGSGKNFFVSTGAPFVNCIAGGGVISYGSSQLMMKTADLVIPYSGTTGSDGLMIQQNYNGILGNTKIYAGANNSAGRFMA